MKHRMILLWSLLALVAIAMIAGIIAVVLPSRFVDERVFVTVLIVGAYALGGLILIALRTSDAKDALGVHVSLVISLLIYVILIWIEPLIGWRAQNHIAKFASVFLVVGVVLAHRILIVPLRTPTTIAWVTKRAALISALIVGVVIIAGLVTDGFFGWDDLFLRLLGISLIIAAGTSIACGADRAVQRKPGEDEPGLLVGSIPIEMTCPRCDAHMTLRSNRESRCEGCRLKVRVEIEEPRCACGYLLYELESDICPECGRAIPTDDRWSARNDPTD